MRKTFLSIRLLLSTGAATLIGWLGLSGCNRSEMNSGMCMYGTPTVSYRFKVKVVDQEGKPVENIQVGVMEDAPNARQTDSEGQTTVQGSYTGSYQDHDVTFVVRDIDGEKNGVVTDLTRNEKITTADFVEKKRDGWENGTVSKDINLKVERK